MWLVYRLIAFILGGLLLFGVQQQSVLAQETLSEVYFCVAPSNTEKEPYLIEFLDSSAFGILVPEDAQVMMFSNTFYTLALYTINTSARSGGYLTMEHLTTANTMTRIPVDNPCAGKGPQNIFDRLPFQSIPLPISVNHAIIVQRDKSDELDNPFQRVISFTFGIGIEDAELRNLQIIQISEFEPFLNFRYHDIAPNTPFMVVANKDFGIGQSLPDTNPPEFSRERPSDIRSFVKSDLQDLYGLDIFDVAERSNARIYINSGLLDTYRGTYIRISLAPDTVERIPALQSGTMIKALPDAKAAFVAIDQAEDDPLQLDLPYNANPLGQILGDSTYQIIELNETTGQLVIDFNGNPAIVESWLIEAVPEN